MHDGIHAPIEYPVLGLQSHDPKRAGLVVLATTTIRTRKTAHVRVLAGRPPFAAPLGARHLQPVGHVAFVSAELCVGVVKIRRVYIFFGD
jgi:hypothetical protein